MKTKQALNLKITVDSGEIYEVDSVKYLGILRINFWPPFNVSKLQSKLSLSTKILSKTKYCTVHMTEYFFC